MLHSPFELTNWQKIQVSLLYHYASFGYLKGLQRLVHQLMQDIDPALDLAKLQNRDALITNTRWGIRDSSKNWADNGWPILADFELAIATQLAKRAYESYTATGSNQYERGLAELSLNWMTPDEQEVFERKFSEISHYAMKVDDTLSQHEQAGRWDDFGLSIEYRESSYNFSQAPKLRLRLDVVGITGKTPPRTGVYLPVDNLHGTPQFCWTGTPAGVLLEANSFNDLGLEALTAVGRRDLWVDDERMYEFAQDHRNDPRLMQDPLFDDSIDDVDLTSSLVARNSFTSRACEWIFVEQVHGELEEWEDESTISAENGVRVVAGVPCPKEGFYFTPASPSSRRYFMQGEMMPNTSGDYGLTIWQMDDDQRP